jgi:hypothetical protein
MKSNIQCNKTTLSGNIMSDLTLLRKEFSVLSKVA